MQAGEQGIKPDFAQSYLNLVDIAEADPAQLLPQLLDQLITLGQMAQQLSQALGGNGYRPEKAAELIQKLVNERR